jgi:hypothetical protein
VGFDLTWTKITALTVVQSAAGTALSALGNGAFNVISADWETVGSLSAGSALSTLLALVVAYKLPNGPAQAVSTAAPLNAPAALCADADEAKKR